LDCIAKTVTCWSNYAWVTMTLYYPQLQKGGIPPEQHPAVIEDEWLAQPGAFLVDYQKRKGWKQGYTRDVIINYLRLNGPQIVKAIADDIGGNAVQVTSILKRYPELFKIVGRIDIKGVSSRGPFISHASVWGLTEEATN